MVNKNIERKDQLPLCLIENNPAGLYFSSIPYKIHFLSAELMAIKFCFQSLLMRLQLIRTIVSHLVFAVLIRFIAGQLPARATRDVWINDKYLVIQGGLSTYRLDFGCFCHYCISPRAFQMSQIQLYFSFILKKSK